MASNDPDDQNYESDFESDDSNSLNGYTTEDKQVVQALPEEAAGNVIDPASSDDSPKETPGSLVSGDEGRQASCGTPEDMPESLKDRLTNMEDHVHIDRPEPLQSNTGFPGFPFLGAHLPTPPTSPRCRPARNLSPGRYRTSRSPSSSPHRHREVESESTPSLKISPRFYGDNLDSESPPKPFSDPLCGTFTVSPPGGGVDTTSTTCSIDINERPPTPHILTYEVSPFVLRNVSITDQAQPTGQSNQHTGLDDQPSRLPIDTEEVNDDSVTVIRHCDSSGDSSAALFLSVPTIGTTLITDDETDSDGDWEVNFVSIGLSDEQPSASQVRLSDTAFPFEPMLAQGNESNTFDNSASLSESGREGHSQTISNILLPNQVANESSNDQYGAVIVAQTIDLAHISMLSSATPRNELSVESAHAGEGVSELVLSETDSSDGELPPYHRPHYLGASSRNNMESTQTDDNSSDDVDEESRPVTPPPWNKELGEPPRYSSDDSESVSDEDNESDSELAIPPTYINSNTLESRIIGASLSGSVLRPVVVSSNSSVATQILANISQPDEQITFEQLMNMDASTLGDMEDDSSSSLDDSEAVTGWSWQASWEADNPLLAPANDNADVDTSEYMQAFSQMVEDGQSSRQHSVTRNSSDGESDLYPPSSLFENEGLSGGADALANAPFAAAQIPLVNYQQHEELASQHGVTRPSWMSEDEWRAVLDVIRDDLAEAGAAPGRTSIPSAQSSPAQNESSFPSSTLTQNLPPATLTPTAPSEDTDRRGGQDDWTTSGPSGVLGLQTSDLSGEQPPPYSSLFTDLDMTQDTPPEYSTLPPREEPPARQDSTGNANFLLQYDSSSIHLAIASNGQDVYSLILQDDVPLVAKLINEGQNISEQCSKKAIKIKSKFKIPMDINDTRRMCIDKKRSLLVVTMNCAVLRIKFSGKVKDVITSPADTTSRHKLKSLMGIDYCESADLYVVTDVMQHCVLLINPVTKAVVSRFGEQGSGWTQLDNPRSVKCCVSQGVLSLVVCDTENNRLRMYNTEGQSLRTSLFGSEECPLRAPVDVCIDDNGDMYVADRELKMVFRYQSQPGRECWETFVPADQLQGMTPQQLVLMTGSGPSTLLVMASSLASASHNNMHMFPFLIAAFF